MLETFLKKQNIRNQIDTAGLHSLHVVVIFLFVFVFLCLLNLSVIELWEPQSTTNIMSRMCMTNIVVYIFFFLYAFFIIYFFSKPKDFDELSAIYY